MMQWPEYNIGDHVVGNDRAEGSWRDRTAICISNTSETQFGHKHVEVQFDDNGENRSMRTIHLTKIEIASEPDPEDPFWKPAFQAVEDGSAESALREAENS